MGAEISRPEETRPLDNTDWQDMADRFNRYSASEVVHRPQPVDRDDMANRFNRFEVMNSPVGEDNSEQPSIPSPVYEYNNIVTGPRLIHPPPGTMGPPVSRENRERSQFPSIYEAPPPHPRAINHPVGYQAVETNPFLAESPPPYTPNSDIIIDEISHPPSITNPPPFVQENALAVAPQRIPQTPIITAHDSPKWRWSNRECREWIRAILIHCGRNDTLAYATAQQFVGCGSTLFHKTARQWRTYLGSIEGDVVWCKMLDVRATEVPKAVHLHHLYPVLANGRCSKCGKMLDD